MKMDQITKRLMNDRIKSARYMIRMAEAELDRASKLIFDVEERMLDFEDVEYGISGPQNLRNLGDVK